MPFEWTLSVIWSLLSPVWMEDNDDFWLRNVLSTDSRLGTERHQEHKSDQKIPSLLLMTLQIIAVPYGKCDPRDVHRMRAAWPTKKGLQVDLTVMHHEINQEMGMHYVFPAILWMQVACFYYRTLHIWFFFCPDYFPLKYHYGSLPYFMQHHHSNVILSE